MEGYGLLCGIKMKIEYIQRTRVVEKIFETLQSP